MSRKPIVETQAMEGETATAYGDGHSPEDLEYTEILFRCEDLLREWYRTFFAHVWTPDGGDAAERLALERAERRLEETAMELALHLKARRLKMKGGLELLPAQKRGEGAA